MLNTICLLLLLGLGAAVHGASLSLDDDSVHLRPGQTQTIAYSVLGGPGTHQLVQSGSVAGLTVVIDDDGDNAGAIVCTATGTTAVNGNLQFTVWSGGVPITPARTVACRIDPRPRLSNPALVLNLVEDTAGMNAVACVDDAASLTFTVASPQTDLQSVSVTAAGLKNCNLTIQASSNRFGSASVTLTVDDDLVGDPTYLTIPLAIAGTNDAPDIALTTPPTPTMHPDAGTPVAMLERIAITPGVDITGVNLTATVGATTTRLSWLAEIVGTTGHPSLPGCDVLALRGDAGYRIDAATISVLPAGTAIADWTRPDGRSDRIQVTLRAGGTLAQVEEIARLLHYAYLQSPATAFTRTLRLTVSEPDPAGGVDPSTPVSCPIQIAAVNRPPVVTLSPLTVEPMGAASLPILLADADRLDNLTVRVVAPLPSGGRIEPQECSGTQAVAGVLRYTHTASDISDDRVTIAVSDASETVFATTTVAIRTTPDRISIVSDPLFALERGRPATLNLQAVPTGCVFTLEAYGHPLPPCPGGVAIVGDELRFDWTTIPGNTTWIALAVKATNTPSGFAPAVQHMLIRVLPPTPVASTP